ncbi:OLC1v1023615C1 [Oldenlandia corymbosa var. corymbosa]|uniref:OLC1v1023615C1 n=1 Tax=Oldenlandia corymbosa var. corymbosa TaxID=529605 RepID=A0AAV1C131_OLDCO|nr:OLC1v1023615C1 [Oldenlandia corymbosa var. corymbosa]
MTTTDRSTGVEVGGDHFGHDDYDLDIYDIMADYAGYLSFNESDLDDDYDPTDSGIPKEEEKESASAPVTPTEEPKKITALQSSAAEKKEKSMNDDLSGPDDGLPSNPKIICAADDE